MWVISPLLWVISIVTLLITLLISTHQPPSIPYRISIDPFKGTLITMRSNPSLASRAPRKYPSCCSIAMLTNLHGLGSGV